MEQQVITFGKAVYILIRPTWMLSLSQLCMASLPLITFLTMAHSGHTNLVATGIGIIFCNLTGLSVMLVLSVACEEFSLNRKTFEEAVVTIQKSLYVCLLTISFLSWALWMNSGSILAVLGFSVEISGLSEDYSFSFLPGLVVFVVCIFLQKYMYIVNMEYLLPSMCCNFAVAIFHVIICWIFQFKLNLGVRGAAYTLIVSYLALALLLFMCLMWRQEYRESWPGWSWECFKDHWTYIKFVIPYIIVVGMEWWTFDVGTFIIGSLNGQELPSQLIVVLLLEFLSLVTHQFALGASGQIEDAVRGGFWKRATFILRCSMFLIWIFSILVGALLSGLQAYFTPIYTEHWKLLLSTPEIIILIAPIPFLRGTQALGFHVLRRFGRKKLPVIIAGTSYWGISLPVALILLYYAKRGLQGFWIGYIIGAVAQAMVFLVLLYHKMRQWMEKEDRYSKEGPLRKEPVTPSGQMEMEPFVYEDVVDGKKRSSINIDYPRIYTPFDVGEMSTDAGPSDKENANTAANNRPGLRTFFLRTFVFMFAVCIFIVGIVVRFFVPGIHKGHDHDL